MRKTQIVLSVYGGVVQDVYCSDESAEVTIVDWDAEEADATAPNLVELKTTDSRTERAFVITQNAQPLASLCNTDVAAALEQAGMAPDIC